MKRLLSILSVAVLGMAAPLSAQLAEPNEMGVSFAQWHTLVHDVEATKKFWTTVGATPIKIDGTVVMKFPGVFIFIEKGSPTPGGNYGAALNHVSFLVPNSQETIERWKAAGLTTEYLRPQVDKKGPPRHAEKEDAVASAGTNAYTPDNLKVGLNDAKNQTVPIASPLISVWVTSAQVPEVMAWYGKMFGGKSGAKIGGDGVAVENLPGTRMHVVTSAGNPDTLNPLTVGLIHGKVPDEAFVAELLKPGRTQPTKGRTLDYIGFEVNNLEAFCKKLAANGMKFDEPYLARALRHKSFASAMLTDPWGVSIELTEGLRKF